MITFLVLTLSHLGVQALSIPIPITGCTSQSQNDGRTIWNIIWSCLITIFSCTWVAIHPNIPSPTESRGFITLHRVQIVVFALIAPEFIIVWAIRQWVVARDAQRRNGAWTPTHGFFVSMGGFMLCNQNGPVHPLTLSKIESLTQQGHIDFPDITKDEIKDRSKGDILSKGLAILQTGWFLVQCLARAIQRLPITELELMTVAFATLNLMTYVFWWDKPLNVQYPLRIPLKRPVGEMGLGKGSSQSGKGDGGWLLWVVRVALGEEDEGVELTKRASVPVFYAGDVDVEKRRLASVAGAVIAMVFGGIHCIGWSFSFPTRIEQILWRVSSVVITCVPLVCLVLLGVLVCFGVDYSGRSRVNRGWTVMYYVGVPTPLVGYVVARVVLLVQAFLTLRELPDGACQVVRWTTFIPHIM